MVEYAQMSTPNTSKTKTRTNNNNNIIIMTLVPVQNLEGFKDGHHTGNVELSGSQDDPVNLASFSSEDMFVKT